MTWFDHEFATMETLRILRDVDEGLFLEVGDISISSDDFHAVARAIASGRISVWHSRSSDFASYDPESDALHVPAGLGRIGALGFLESRSLVIHEAVHAMRDLARSTLSPARDEAIAYITQMRYEFLSIRPERRGAHTPAVIGRPGTAQFEVTTVLRLAYSIASRIGEDGIVPLSDLPELERHIRAIEVPTAENPAISYCPYGATEDRVYDGVSAAPRAR